MRLLVVAAPLVGHVLPPAPFATALRAAGPELRAEIAAVPDPPDVTAAVLAGAR